MINIPDDGLQRFEWDCPRTNCKKYILAWTEPGLRAQKDYHLNQHFKEDMETAQSRLASAIQKHESAKKKSPEEYQKLHLTLQDAAFLKTRHIKIDSDMVIEWL